MDEPGPDSRLVAELRRRSPRTHALVGAVLGGFCCVSLAPNFVPGIEKSPEQTLMAVVAGALVGAVIGVVGMRRVYPAAPEDQLAPRPSVDPARRCSTCLMPIEGTYFEYLRDPLCPPCAEDRRFGRAPGETLPAIARAMVWGLPTAAMAATAYAIVSIRTGFIYAWLALAVGWLVGKAVRHGDGRRGGLPIQLIAALFTYAALVASRLAVVFWLRPPPWSGFVEWTVGLVLVLPVAASLPFSSSNGTMNALAVGGLIVAWASNVRIIASITGPHGVEPAAKIEV